MNFYLSIIFGLNIQGSCVVNTTNKSPKIQWEIANLAVHEL